MDATYRIRIKGHLEDRWSERFDGMAIERQVDGTTILVGPVVDQPALHGMLELIRNLGLQLLDVNRVDTCQPNAPPSSRAGPARQVDWRATRTSNPHHALEFDETPEEIEP